jgi:hypothetical protein
VRFSFPIVQTRFKRIPVSTSWRNQTDQMKISIPIIQDSENSYPCAELELVEFDDSVCIKISDSDREVFVRKEELRKMLVVLSD